MLVRGTGDPLYTLVNPVDDALMGITHVLRGEDLLPSTPRQIALYEALIDIGRAEVVPQFGHLPFVTGEGNRKLSKRDPQSNLFQYRDDGFITEGMVNYLALLGWSHRRATGTSSPPPSWSPRSTARGSPATRPGSTGKKAEAINGAHIRLLAAGRLRRPADRVPGRRAAMLPGGARPPTSCELVAAAAPLVQERSALLSEAAAMVAFLFAADDVRGRRRRPRRRC